MDRNMPGEVDDYSDSYSGVTEDYANEFSTQDLIDLLGQLAVRTVSYETSNILQSASDRLESQDSEIQELKDRVEYLSSELLLEREC